MKLLFLVCLLPLTAMAQFGVEQPFFSATVSSSPDSLLPSGIGYRWKSSDLSSSPVADWVDEIQSCHLTQSTVALRPTWSTNGVAFNSANTQWFTGTNGLYAGSSSEGKDCFLLVLKLDSLDEQYLMYSSSSAVYLGIQGSGWRLQSNAYGLASTNRFLDFVYAGVSGGKFSSYTNGVLLVNDSGAESSYGTMNYFGRHSAAVYFNGKVREFIIWTNVVSFSSSQVTNIHNYVKQVYPDVTP